VTLTTCPGCGVALPSDDGPTHSYVVSSPACWRLFTEYLTANRHRLLTDAYMAQHPDGDDPRQLQSVAVHLVTLHAVLRGGQPLSNASRITSRAVEAGRRRGAYPVLSRPTTWQWTVADVAAGQVLVEEYISSVLEAWEPLEGDRIGRWAKETVSDLYS
jgi:Family of unknown function (DUF5946)